MACARQQNPVGDTRTAKGWTYLLANSNHGSYALNWPLLDNERAVSETNIGSNDRGARVRGIEYSTGTSRYFLIFKKRLLVFDIQVLGNSIM